MKSKKGLILLSVVVAFLLMFLIYILFFSKNSKFNSVEMYTVFIDNGINDTIIEKKVPKGTSIEDLEIPKKENYEFYHWTSPEAKYGVLFINDELIDGMHLKASWVENSKESNEYMNYSDFFELCVEKYGLYSEEYTPEEILAQKDFSVLLDVMKYWEYIDKEQKIYENDYVTREIAARIFAERILCSQDNYVEISDIENSFHKQSIMNMVYYRLLDLKDNKFKPTDYLTYSEVDIIVKKINALSFDLHYEEGGFDLEDSLKDNVHDFTDVPIEDFEIITDK